uniref:(northern house mosquito) hypothetical protein n=1 Tax=Culex pipiens TaxID=7175 RepID=A0A8D8BG18_CULPI
MAFLSLVNACLHVIEMDFDLFLFYYSILFFLFFDIMFLLFFFRYVFICFVILFFFLPGRDRFVRHHCFLGGFSASASEAPVPAEMEAPWGIFLLMQNRGGSNQTVP